MALGRVTPRCCRSSRAGAILGRVVTDGRGLPEPSGSGLPSCFLCLWGPPLPPVTRLPSPSLPSPPHLPPCETPLDRDKYRIHSTHHPAASDLSLWLHCFSFKIIFLKPSLSQISWKALQRPPLSVCPARRPLTATRPGREQPRLPLSAEVHSVPRCPLLTFSWPGIPPWLGIRTWRNYSESSGPGDPSLLSHLSGKPSHFYQYGLADIHSKWWVVIQYYLILLLKLSQLWLLGALNWSGTFLKCTEGPVPPQSGPAQHGCPATLPAPAPAPAWPGPCAERASCRALPFQAPTCGHTPCTWGPGQQCWEAPSL